MLARIAIESEAAAVVELARLQMAESLPHLEFDQHIAHRTFASYLAAASPTIFVVEGHDREPVGFLTANICNYEFARGFYVARNPLFVRADFRDTAAAEALERAYDEWAARLSPSGAFALNTVGRTGAPEGYTAFGVLYRRKVA